MNPKSTDRVGLTLVEIILAMTILTVVFVAVTAYVRQPAERVKTEACNLRIEQLELISAQYFAEHGTWPSADMRELAGPRYLGESLPLCPVDQRPFQWDPISRTVVAHNHP